MLCCRTEQPMKALTVTARAVPLSYSWNHTHNTQKEKRSEGGAESQFKTKHISKENKNTLPVIIPI